MTRGFDRMDDRTDRRFAAVDARFLVLEQKVDRHFVWIVGIQLTMMMTMISAFAAAYFR
jgi:hypothetical protein